jgi:RimJ/RimL family protein N-acetyltransferase
MEDEELFRFIGNPLKGEGIASWLAHDAEIRLTTPNEEFRLAVVRNDTRKVVGWVALRFEPRYREQATLDIVIAREHQRNGFGAEAMGGLLGFSLQGIKLHRVVAYCDGRDQAGQRMLEKSGLRCEANFLEDRREGNEWVDTVWFALLQREYPPAETPATPGGSAEPG